MEWLAQAQPEVLCLQEVKAQKEDLTEVQLSPPGYASVFNFAQKKGYSGVGIYSKVPFRRLEFTLNLEPFDSEGRTLLIDLGSFYLINLYLPHGGRQKEKLGYKLACYQALHNIITGYSDKPLLLVGDFNIAHQERDVARFKQNYQNIMFTAEERNQIDRLIQTGFTDTLRLFHPESGLYTWWAYLNESRAKNLGWRIDYLFSSPKITPLIKDSFILPEILGSDHCPAGIEL